MPETSAGGSVTTPPFPILTDEERSLLVPEPVPEIVPPMLATLAHGVPAGPGWVYERKLDGVRVLGFKRGSDVWLMTRNHKRVDGAWPELVEALAAQPARELVVDGEVVAFDESGRTSFERLQGRMQLRDPRRARLTGIAITYVAFDLVHVDGFGVEALPLVRRKELLASVLELVGPLALSEHLEGSADDLLATARAEHWEGLMGKRAASRYEHRRSRDWLKLKVEARQEFVIGGWTDPQGSRTALGSLLIGYYDGDELVFAGKVGTGFDERTLRQLSEVMDRIGLPASPFDRGTGLPRKGAHWVEPVLVGEVGFSEWTRDGKVRHPRFVGWRTDKDPREVAREG